MIAAIPIIAVLLFFIGICLYGILMPKIMVRRGRQVDARVISCVKKSLKLGGQTGTYYEITVDFYGLDGQTIQRAFKSDQPVEEGEVIRSRYIDKTGFFLWDADKDARNKKNQGGIWFVIGFALLMLALIISILVLQDENGNLPHWYETGLAYGTCILFMGVSAFDLQKRIRRSQNKHNHQIIPGYVVDYIRKRDDDKYLYCPIYEYEVQGVKYQQESKVSSTSTNRCTIGRKVQMVRDCETGAVFCKEDEKTGSRITLALGIVGLVVFLMLLGTDAGVLQNSNVAEPGGERATHFEDGRQDVQPDDEDEESETMSVLQVYLMYAEGTEKCSYSFEITEEGSGKVILFPTKTVSGKVIDQQISFEVSLTDILKIAKWVSDADIFNLDMADVEGEELSVTVYVKEGDEQAGGRGPIDQEPYQSMYELLQDIVPNDVWKEMTDREEEYYSE